MKKLIVLGIALMSCTLAFAVDQAAKEDITPPAAEDALTVDQIPPIRSMGPKNATQPATAPSQLTVPNTTVPEAATTPGPINPQPMMPTQ